MNRTKFLRVGEEEYGLLFTHSALYRLQEDHGLGIGECFHALNPATGKRKEARAVVLEGLEGYRRAENAEAERFTEDAVDAILDSFSIEESSETVMRAFSLGVLGKEPEELKGDSEEGKAQTADG